MKLTRLAVPLGALAALAAAQDPNIPPGVEVWCGKAYMAQYPSFEPGGWLDPPLPSKELLLDLRVHPRMSLYLEDDGDASFIIQTTLSRTNGVPYETAEDSSSGYEDLSITISVADSDLILVTDQTVPVNETSTEVSFPLAELTPRSDPYEILLTATTTTNHDFTAKTQIRHLPQPPTTIGSISRIDSLYDGIYIRDTRSYSTWAALFPYAYYVNWGDWLSLSLSNLDTYASYGYNMLHIVPPGGPEPFNWTQLEPYLDRCDELGLYIMWDMRHTYQNASLVTPQIEHLLPHRSLLLWYTADEPDGQTDPLNATAASYAHIRSLDPYHPVSLVLNCQNYFFDEYTRGTDIILSDVYPVGINATFSTVWDTPCNRTYGDCGCDNCLGRWEDISDRLDVFVQYADWLGHAPKPLWAVPQAFGEQSYWPRYPTPQEEVMMNVLSVNHGAMGVAMWIFPTTDEIAEETGRLSRALTREDVTALLVSARAEKLGVQGPDRVDVAGWRVDGKMLVSIVFLQETDGGSATVDLGGVEAVRIADEVWGSGWEIADGKLQRDSLESLGVWLLVIDVE